MLPKTNFQFKISNLDRNVGRQRCLAQFFSAAIEKYSCFALLGFQSHSSIFKSLLKIEPRTNSFKLFLDVISSLFSKLINILIFKFQHFVWFQFSSCSLQAEFKLGWLELKPNALTTWHSETICINVIFITLRKPKDFFNVLSGKMSLKVETLKTLLWCFIYLILSAILFTSVFGHSVGSASSESVSRYFNQTNLAFPSCPDFLIQWTTELDWFVILYGQKVIDSLIKLNKHYFAVKMYPSFCDLHTQYQFMCEMYGLNGHLLFMWDMWHELNKLSRVAFFDCEKSIPSWASPHPTTSHHISPHHTTSQHLRPKGSKESE